MTIDKEKLAALEGVDVDAVNVEPEAAGKDPDADAIEAARVKELVDRCMRRMNAKPERFVEGLQVYGSGSSACATLRGRESRKL